MNVAVSEPAEELVLDASAAVDMLVGTSRSTALRRRLGAAVLHTPAHLDSEVLSALARLHRADAITAPAVHAALTRLAAMPVRRYPLTDLLPGAWGRRDNVRMADAIYVELATNLGLSLLTTDQRLARACPVAEAVEEP